jgi:RNA polymerase sigma factor (sigma-70 family)
MHDPTPTSSMPRHLDSERSYFGELATVPRFHRDCEVELARAVVRTRRAYWTVLLSSAHLERVLDAIVEHGTSDRVVALATSLRAAARSETTVGIEQLVAALDDAGDEHAASEAIVSLAASIDAAWRREAEKARAAYFAARNRFVKTNLRLVVAFANRYGAHLMPLVDRIQEGNIGLIKAVDRYDPERGVKFCTYAAWWIRHSITRALSIGARTVRIPPQIQMLFAKAERARRRLGAELGREPELSELAAVVGCETDRLQWVMDTMQLRNVSLQAPVQDGVELAESIGDDDSLAALENVIDRGDRVRAVEALRELSAREQDILHERFEFAGSSRLPLSELGRRHGVSRERARQLQQGALEQLKAKLEPSKSRRLQPFQWANETEHHIEARASRSTST